MCQYLLIYRYTGMLSRTQWKWHRLNGWKGGDATEAPVKGCTEEDQPKAASSTLNHALYNCCVNISQLAGFIFCIHYKYLYSTDNLHSTF